jgi:hypothetical protein
MTVNDDQIERIVLKGLEDGDIRRQWIVNFSLRFRLRVVQGDKPTIDIG